MSEKFNYEKKMIGHLIGYYYKQSNYSVNNFLSGQDEFLDSMCKDCQKCNKPERICSKNTLYRLSDGLIVSNECIYHRLAAKLGKKVILDQYDIYERLENYRKLLVENLVDFNKTNLEKLESLIAIDLKKYENVIYMYEVLSLYLNLIKDRLYTNYTPRKNDIKVYLYLIDVSDITIQKIIYIYFYKGKFRRGDYNIDLDLIIQKCNKNLDDPLFYENKLDYVYYTDQLSAYNFLINEEQSKAKNLTSYQKYLLYDAFQIVHVNTESFEEAYKYMMKCYEITKSADFSIIETFHCYLRLGFISYCLKEYQQAVDWLLKAFEIRKNLAKDLVILCQSLEHIGDINKLKEILKNTNTSITKAPYGKKVDT